MHRKVGVEFHVGIQKSDDTCWRIESYRILRSIGKYHLMVHLQIHACMYMYGCVSDKSVSPGCSSCDRHPCDVNEMIDNQSIVLISVGN